MEDYENLLVAPALLGRGRWCHPQLHGLVSSEAVAHKTGEHEIENSYARSLASPSISPFEA